MPAPFAFRPAADLHPFGDPRPLPEAEAARLLELDRRVLWKPFTQMRDYVGEEQVVIVEGRGNWLLDHRGRPLLDGVSSLWVNVHGHRVPEVDAAVAAQLGRLAHSTLLGPSHPAAIELAAELVARAPSPRLSRVFYSDSGSTAVEIAVKMAFQYWKQQPRESDRARDVFVTLDNAYHGDTLGSVSVGGISLFHGLYAPLLFRAERATSPSCYRCPLGRSLPGCGIACADDVERAFAAHPGRVAALVVEPLVQGAAGILVYPDEFLARAARIARDHGALLIVDEVATGFGRTGTMWACEQAGVEPDLLCAAKGIGAGYLPLAATLATEAIYDAFLGAHEDFRTFFHGHSFTGNPLACAAGLASLRLFDEGRVLERARALGGRLGERLAPFRDHPRVGDVRRRGVMVGIELVRDRGTKEPYPPAAKVGQRVVARAREAGVLARPLGPVLVLNPPLSLTDDEADLLCGVLYEAMDAVTLELDGELGG
ncbi:adenosylmethionine--8-amino-7-oxononanoate transaminase [Myxococcota bacterium]|nr:adenosylmethionine--8-amino-7-oxononanoate transaminase [Myxococcota bacterium]